MLKHNTDEALAVDWHRGVFIEEYPLRNAQVVLSLTRHKVRSTLRAALLKACGRCPDDGHLAA